MQTDRQTDRQTNFFHMTLLTVEGITGNFSTTHTETLIIVVIRESNCDIPTCNSQQFSRLSNFRRNTWVMSMTV